MQAIYAPEQYGSISCTGSESYHCPGKQGEIRLGYDLFLQFVLQRVEPFPRVVSMFHRGNECPVLDVLLNVALHAAVRVLDVPGQPAEFPETAFAQYQCDRHDEKYCQCKSVVDFRDEISGENQLDKSTGDFGNRIAYCFRDFSNVIHQSVQQVARVHFFLAGPFPGHDPSEKPASDIATECYLALGFDSRACYGQCLLQQYAPSEYKCESQNPSFRVTGRNVDQMLAYPDKEH